MPLNPPPSLQGNMLLVKQQLIRSDMSRAAELEYCLSTADSTLATYQDAIDDFQANFNTNIVPFIDSEVSVLPPTGNGGDGSTVPLQVVAAGAAATGGSALAMAPPNVALLVRKRTASGGRKNRGRTYIPFVLANAQVNENGSITNAFLVLIQPALTAFLAQLATDSTPMAIENRDFNSPTPPRFVIVVHKSAALVTAYQAEVLVATQRRRLDR